MFEWAYSGANKGVPRNVGPECAYFLSTQRKIIETIIVTSFCIYVLVSVSLELFLELKPYFLICVISNYNLIKSHVISSQIKASINY